MVSGMGQPCDFCSAILFGPGDVRASLLLTGQVDIQIDQDAWPAEFLPQRGNLAVFLTDWARMIARLPQCLDQCGLTGGADADDFDQWEIVVQIDACM